MDNLGSSRPGPPPDGPACPDPDPEWTEYTAWVDREIAAGRDPESGPGTWTEAGHLIDDAIDLTSRLPRTLAGMAAGLIAADRAGWIAFYTRSLSPADTARAEEVLAAAAPGLRAEQLARKADALEKKLNPEGAETLLGLSTTPAQAGSWGLLDAAGTRALAAAAAAHPATRWCVTLTGPDGTALAHGCARGPRPHLLDDLGPQPPPAQPPPARLAELLRRLNITLTPVAQGDCDHATAEKGYGPSRKLRHVVRARTAACDAPGCQSPPSPPTWTTPRPGPPAPLTSATWRRRVSYNDTGRPRGSGKEPRACSRTTTGGSPTTARWRSATRVISGRNARPTGRRGRGCRGRF
jgi:hypothetical protein